jgi:ribosomal protein S18 acetylase RimI-like enzyme
MPRIFEPTRDLHSILDFLGDLALKHPKYGNWFPDRFENGYNSSEQPIAMWGDNANLVALANPEHRNEYYIQIDPKLSNYANWEEKIIAWIIAQSDTVCQKEKPAEKHPTKIHSTPLNHARNTILKEKGFHLNPIQHYIRFFIPQQNNIQPHIPSSFTIRAVQPSKDFKKLATSVRTVFGHGDWFTAEVLRQISQMSFYRPDLDLIALNQAGDIAAFCTFRIDHRTKIAQLEPIGTLPQFRRLGLAQALICEGIQKLKKYRPSQIYIGGAVNSPAANKLYDKLGFTEKIADICWER